MKGRRNHVLWRFYFQKIETNMCILFFILKKKEIDFYKDEK